MVVLTLRMIWTLILGGWAGSGCGPHPLRVDRVILPHLRLLDVCHAYPRTAGPSTICLIH